MKAIRKAPPLAAPPPRLSLQSKLHTLLITLGFLVSAQKCLQAAILFASTENAFIRLSEFTFSSSFGFLFAFYAGFVIMFSFAPMMPSLAHVLLKRRSALSKDSFSLTFTSDILFPSLPVRDSLMIKSGVATFFYHTFKNYTQKLSVRQ